MEVEYPVSLSGPMLVVYWARWADATGSVGRFSKTCVGRIEGWPAGQAPGANTAPGRALPEGVGASVASGGAQPGGTGAQQVEVKYVILEAPYVLPAADDDDDAEDAAAPTEAEHRLLGADAEA